MEVSKKKVVLLTLTFCLTFFFVIQGFSATLRPNEGKTIPKHKTLKHASLKNRKTKQNMKSSVVGSEQVLCDAIFLLHK